MFTVGQSVVWRGGRNDLFFVKLIQQYGPGPFEVVGVIESLEPGPARCSCGAIRRLDTSNCCWPQHDHDQRCAIFQMPPSNQLTIITADGLKDLPAELFELAKKTT